MKWVSSSEGEMLEFSSCFYLKYYLILQVLNNLRILIRINSSPDNPYAVAASIEAFPLTPSWFSSRAVSKFVEQFMWGYQLDLQLKFFQKWWDNCLKLHNCQLQELGELLVHCCFTIHHCNYSTLECSTRSCLTIVPLVQLIQKCGKTKYKLFQYNVNGLCHSSMQSSHTQLEQHLNIFTDI